MLPSFSLAKIAAGVALVLALLAGVWKIHHTGVVAGRAEIQAVWDQDKIRAAEESAKKIGEVKKTSAELQAAADKEKGNLNAHIRSIDLERDELLKRLRDRPVRPAESGGSVPASPGTGASAPSCTGAELFREDAEFLTREASRAEILRAHIKSLESQYERVRKLINGP